MPRNPRETPIERIFREVTGREMPQSVKRILLRKQMAKPKTKGWGGPWRRLQFAAALESAVAVRTLRDAICPSRANGSRSITLHTW
jgi:hypothetical protein